METVITVFLVYSVFRFVVWMILQVFIGRLIGIASAMNVIYAEYGYTRGQLEKAGVTEILDKLKIQGTKIYRRAVPFASILYGWPLLVFFFKKRICITSAGNRNYVMRHVWIWHDFLRGFVPKQAHLGGPYTFDELADMLRALKSAKLFFFFI